MKRPNPSFNEQAEKMIMTPKKRTMRNLEIPNAEEMKRILEGVATLGISILSKQPQPALAVHRRPNRLDR